MKLQYNRERNNLQDDKFIFRGSQAQQSQQKNPRVLQNPNEQKSFYISSGSSNQKTNQDQQTQQTSSISQKDYINQGNVILNRSRVVSVDHTSKKINRTTNNSPEEKLLNICMEKDLSFGLLTELQNKGVNMECIGQLISEHMKLDVKATGFVDKSLLINEIQNNQFWNPIQKQEQIKIIENVSVKGFVSFVKINHFAHAFSKLPKVYNKFNQSQNEIIKQEQNTDLSTIQDYSHVIREAIKQGQFQSYSSAFIFFDSDCNSQIISDEFLNGCNILNIQLSDDQIIEVFNFLDRQSKGYLTEEEFKHFYYDRQEFLFNIPLKTPPQKQKPNYLPSSLQKRAPSLNGNQMYLNELEYDTPVSKVRRQSVSTKYSNSYLSKKDSEERNKLFKNDSQEEAQLNKQKKEQDLKIKEQRQKIGNILSQSKNIRSISVNKTALLRQQYINNIYQQDGQVKNHNLLHEQKQRRIHTDQDEYSYLGNYSPNQYLQTIEPERNQNYISINPQSHSYTQPYQQNNHNHKEQIKNMDNLQVPDKCINCHNGRKLSLKQSSNKVQQLSKNPSSSFYDSKEDLDKMDNFSDQRYKNKTIHY